MEKICKQCGKKIGFFSLDPLELGEGQYLCYHCAEDIKGDIVKLYNIKEVDSFIATKDAILSCCADKYSQSVYEMIETLINSIYENTEFVVQRSDDICASIRPMSGDAVYCVKGVRGRYLHVYPDKVIINTKATLSSFLTGNASDGEKTIYYVDCVGIQYKHSGVLIGYLQLETASALTNNVNSNFFAENTFTYDTTVVLNEQMDEVADYIKKQIEQYKKSATNQVFSSADEIKKFKELLDLGIITQEEFEAKKKQLLGL